MMRKRFVLIFIALSLLAANAVNAQTKTSKELERHRTAIENSRKKGSIIVSLDTIYNEGLAYGILKPEKKSIYLFTVQTLKGEDVINIDGETSPGTFIFTFPDLEDKSAYVENNFLTPVSKIIVQRDLLTPTSLNEESAEKLIAIFNKQPRLLQKKNATGVMIERNRSAAIFTEGGSVIQDEKIVGTYKAALENTSTTNSEQKVVYFYFPNGALCARVVMPAENGNTAQLTTAKDNKEHAVKTNAAVTIKDVATYLVEKLYM
jgi:hypothetical protein